MTMEYSKEIKCQCCGDFVELVEKRTYELARMCRDCYFEKVLGILPPIERAYISIFGGATDPAYISEVQYEGDALNAVGCHRNSARNYERSG